ncbi:hypothetical protein ACJMK2_018214 [Sinanodonta woodiana]|uniref:Uncharacterized protein n=1 Tax=Sinanodonta woodiana TaxID=1069815 RepID=A0ABD3UGC3_SINWO
MLQGNMDVRKMAYLELFLLTGILILGVDSQKCSDLQSSVQPCLMVIMNEFSSIGQSSGQSSLGIMTIFCKQEVKAAMVCIFEAVKACPEIAPSLNSIPGMANMDSNTLDSMCSAMMDFSSQEVCITSALNSTRHMSCLASMMGMSQQEPCEMYKATAICSLRILQQECPSVVAAFNYSLKFSKPPTCPDVVIADNEGMMDGPCFMNDTDRYTQCGTRAMMGLSQLSSNAPGMESLIGVLNYICGSAKTEVTCFLEGYEKCPKFKMNSDKTGLTTTFQPKPLKDLVMTGCKNVNELGKHSQCMNEQFESTEFQKCVETAAKTYPGPSSPSEPMSCNLYNAMKACLHDSVGDNCDHGVAEYLAKWSSIIFKTNEDCTTAGAPMSLSSIFLMLALFATVFIL